MSHDSTVTVIGLILSACVGLAGRFDPRLLVLGGFVAFWLALLLHPIFWVATAICAGICVIDFARFLFG